MLGKLLAICLRCGPLSDPLEGEPDHHFGMSEMAACSAHFPNAVIRFSPRSFQIRRDHCGDCRTAPMGRQATFARLRDRIHDFTEDVELELACGCIADA